MRLILNGPVGFADGFTAAAVKQLLARCKGDLTVHINSVGGSVIEGLAIFTALQRYEGGRVTCRVDVLAESVASVIALAGHRLEMSPTAHLMIHGSRVVQGAPISTIGASAVVGRHLFDALFRRIYSVETGLSEAKVGELMAAEARLSAEECVRLGFADAIREAT